ncbi:MAG: carboxypeptidase regulatory-like domain-containing protein, partial [Acidobacteriia bacterium]|nr:carboxypeptidase regulatory-like domain-containing protein [Terriglobia bacterium]
MTRSTLRLVVLAVVLTSVVGPVGGGELRGRLFLGSDPAPGVSVLAVPYEAPLDEARREARRLPPPQPIAVVTTDPEGWFALAVPVEPGKEKLFTVQTEGGGTAAASVAGIWDAAETADLGDHALSPGGKLAGRATDAAGTPVADAGVVLLPQADPAGDPEIEAAPRFVRTGADGSFHFDVASAVGNTVTVEKAGRLIAQQTGVRAGSLGAPIVLSRGAPVSGTVRTSDGRPMAGTLVRLEGRVATRWVETGADGSFTIPNAPAGAFTAVADGGETGYVERAGVRLPLTQGTSLALVLKPPSALVGRALDAMSGRPVPRATIEVRAAGRARTTRSLPDGSYALRGLPPGSWRLRADEPRFVPWTQANVSLRAGETKKLDIPLVMGASLAGRVTDEDGRAVANARGSLTRMGPV